MARIVHASDLHIDSVAGPPAGDPHGLPIDVRGAIRRAVARLVALVLRERADLLIISGDVFDRSADSAEAGRFFAAQMGRLHEAGVPVLVAAGNHDAVCPRATGYPANVRWFAADAPASYRFDELGLAVHGQGLADPTEPGDLTAAFPAPLSGYLNLGVLHTSLDGRGSRTICAPTSAAQLAARGYDYWALGHVHQRQVVSTAPWLVYPGNVQGRGPAEPGSKGATVVTTEAGAVTGISHRELAVLRWEQVAVDGAGARGHDEVLARVWDRLTSSAGSVAPMPVAPVVADVTVTGTASVPSLAQLQAVARERPELLVHRVR